MSLPSTADSSPTTGLVDRSADFRRVFILAGMREGSRCSCLFFEKQERALAVVRVTVVIAVDEVRPDLSQIAFFDRLTAHHAEGLRAGHPAIHLDESHRAPPDAK